MLMRDPNAAKPSKNPLGVPGTSAGFERVVSRALIDSKFRQQLFSDRAAALQSYDLNDADIEALSRLDAKTLEGARDIAVIVGMVCAVGSGEGNSGKPE
jgi:hypothetical protein